MADFKDRLREQRKMHNLSQAEVAEFLNVSRTAVTNWETGTRLPERSHVEMLTELFNCSMDYLLGRSDQVKTDWKVTALEAVVREAEVERTLAAQITRCREMRQMSSDFFAALIGVEPETVQDWETGAQQPKPADLERLATSLGVSVDYLLGRTAPVGKADDWGEVVHEAANHGLSPNDVLQAIRFLMTWRNSSPEN